MTLSACMIVKNEEDVISRCIKSYYEAVDEIIVVDTGSKDRTVEIAKKNGARVYYFAWQDDFAAAKNFALSKAKGDWIIFLDADEYFANHTGNNIRSFLLNLDESFNSVACKMLNLDQSSGKLLDEITHIRIFKNDKYIRYVNPIHEMLLNRGKSKKMNAFLADPRDIVIHHTGYSYDNRQQKAKRNLELLLRELPKAPEKPAYYQYIADCYFGLENWEKVIEYTNLFMNSGTKMVGYNVRPHQNLIDAMLKLKHSSEDIMDQIDI
ncbi:MAG TPA: glycosyl transferase family 2, partial [Sporomusaceae bacterium]|nr:glycosyl transferase family 2 [Sporomusaceae bacterium]